MTLSTLPRYDADAIAPVGDHAVVVGGSVAGLVTARVLADGFDAVTVLEADELPDGPAHRRGVPQDAQIHALLEAGRATLEDLFPGFGEDFLAAGGILLDGSTDLRLYSEGDFLAEGPNRLPAYSATRPLFEHVVRRRVTALDEVELREGCRATDYLVDGDAGTVGGVALRGDTGESNLSASLVVDATGRTSPTPSWLAVHGYEPPPVDEVDIDVGYSTFVVDRPETDRRAYLAPAASPHSRGGAVFPVENDRWLVNVHGVHGDHPPVDAGGVVDFAASLPVVQIADLAKNHATRQKQADFYPFPSNRRHYYEHLDRFPDGLLVVGDALASFNPIYGQGMSVATLQALVVHHVLAAGTETDIATRYFDEVAAVVDTAWRMAVGADAAFDATTGPTPRGSTAFGRYLSWLTRKAHSDGTLREALMRVIALEQHPTALLRPGIVARAIRPSRPAAIQSWSPAELVARRAP